MFIVFSFLILLVTMVSFAFVFQLGEGPVQVALHGWDGDEHPLRYQGVGQVLVDRDTTRRSDGVRLSHPERARLRLALPRSA